MNQARFGSRGHHRKLAWRSRRIKIQQQNKRKPIADIRLQIKVLLSSLSILVNRSDLPRSGVHEHIERLWKRRATLDVAVADQPKHLALRKDRSLIINRPIAKMERKARGN